MTVSYKPSKNILRFLAGDPVGVSVALNLLNSEFALEMLSVKLSVGVISATVSLCSCTSALPVSRLGCQTIYRRMLIIWGHACINTQKIHSKHTFNDISTWWCISQRKFISIAVLIFSALPLSDRHTISGNANAVWKGFSEQWCLMGILVVKKVWYILSDWFDSATEASGYSGSLSWETLIDLF